MKKSDRIGTYVAALPAGTGGFDPRYTGWFTCFNRGDYYEAHDVLEDLWLETRGEDHLFYKGLIQLAGAFVHLKKQRERPWHPKDGARLRPAARLFALALKNLAPCAPERHRLDVTVVCHLCEAHIAALAAGGENPWSSGALPVIALQQS